MSFYKVLPLNISSKDAFLDASREELRVLLVLIENGREDISDAEIAARAGISKARALSAAVFWEEAGVISKSEDTITYEFEQRLKDGEIAPESSVKVAKTIRNEHLLPLITECENIMKRSMNSTETKEIVALHTQYGLTDEYIATLASYIAKTKKLTPKSLVNKALKLVEREIDTVEALTLYIEERESESETEFAFRKLFGIQNRALSTSEKAYFAKWSREYGYFTSIVGEAYDIAVMSTRKASLSYVDKILKDWHDSGCKTLDECRARYDEEKTRRKAEITARKSAQKPKERYGDFDVDDVFARAIERSYGKNSKE